MNILSIRICDEHLNKIKKYLLNADITSINYTEDVMKIVSMIKQHNITIILFYKSDIRLINDLIWESYCIDFCICMDIKSISELPERNNKLMNKRLWDYVSMKSLNDIMDGGWENSFTRKPFSYAEIKEFQDNTYYKLKPFLSGSPRILEIGCSSGVTIDSIAEYASEYVALDMSIRAVEKLQRRIDREVSDGKYSNTLFVFKCMEADKINELERKRYDIVVLNSVVHCFNNQEYFLDVIFKAADLVRDEGIIFVGDILGLNYKNEFLKSLMEYKKLNKNAKTKIDYSQELFLSKEFVDMIPEIVGRVDSVIVTRKIGKINNELRQYRFDAILKINNKKNTFKRVKTIMLSVDDINEGYFGRK